MLYHVERMLEPSAPGVLAGVMALAMDVVYLVVVVNEGDDDLGQALPFALLIGGAGVALVAGSVMADPGLRASLLWPAGLILTGIGVLAIFSIGVVLLVAGGLGIGAASRATAAAAKPSGG